MKRSFRCAALLLLAFALLSGCGAPAAVEATVEQEAYAQIEGLGDAAGDEEAFASAFVPGSVPENRDDYGERGYHIAGEAVIEGDSAKVPVKIFGGIVSSSTSDRASRGSSSQAETEQMWTLQQSSGEWKIKDAPLG